MQTEETMSNDISADLFEFQSSEDWKALSPYRQKVVQYIFKKLDKNSSGFIEFSDLKLFFSNSVLPNLKARTCLGLSLEYQLKFSVQHECMIDSGCIPQSLSILIVDDSTTVLKVSTAVFEKAGHRVDVATNGKIGLEKMLKKFYDIVLLDVHMPEMDGLETMSLFREQEHSLGREKDKIQFVIAISSNTDELTKKNCMRAGMDAFIKKPFGIGNIVKFVTAFCSKLCIKLESPYNFIHY
jgi:CheY-like chemotaxis protein